MKKFLKQLFCNHHYETITSQTFTVKNGGEPIGTAKITVLQCPLCESERAIVTDKRLIIESRLSIAV